LTKEDTIGLQTEIRDVNYNEFVNLLGTAHFTRRSVKEAYESVERLKPTDLAIELDLQRFNVLDSVCASCPKRSECDRKCEFVGATDALGNADANIWLIDMSEYEIAIRIRSVAHPFSSDVRSYISYADVLFFYDTDDSEEDEVSLWERGFKEKVLDANQRRLELLRRRAPAVWRVLIDERNALMASRLAWVVSKSLDEGRKPKILAVVGAAHVDGIRELLANPLAIRENMRRLGLTFTPPTLIRRVKIKGD
jgi:pheromone shutdown protein TraB